MPGCMGSFLRILLSISALILAAGAVLHAAAFRKALQALSASNLPVFYANSCKGLWLADASTLFTLAILFACIAARPALSTPLAVALLSLIPAATAVLIYVFVGSFFAAHLLLFAAAAALAGGALLPA